MNIQEEVIRAMNWLKDMHDRTFLHVCPRGSNKERPETQAEKRQRKQAIQLIRQYEANHHRSQTK